MRDRSDLLTALLCRLERLDYARMCVRSGEWTDAGGIVDLRALGTPSWSACVSCVAELVTPDELDAVISQPAAVTTIALANSAVSREV